VILDLKTLIREEFSKFLEHVALTLVTPWIIFVYLPWWHRNTYPEFPPGDKNPVDS
jgi:hypothetical protein